MEDPVAVVQEMWDAFARGDGAASLEAFHPDVEWDGRNGAGHAVRNGVYVCEVRVGSQSTRFKIAVVR